MSVMMRTIMTESELYHMRMANFIAGNLDKVSRLETNVEQSQYGNVVSSITGVSHIGYHAMRTQVKVNITLEDCAQEFDKAMRGPFSMRVVEAS